MLIGKSGSNINKLQEKLCIHIDVEPLIPALGKEIDYAINETGNSLEIAFDKRLIGKIASVYIDDKFLFSATIGKKGNIKLTKDSNIGKELVSAILGKKKIKVLI
jgi:ATPase